MPQAPSRELFESIEVDRGRAPLLLNHRGDPRLSEHVAHHLSRQGTALNAGRHGIDALQIIGMLQKFPQALQHPQRLEALIEVEQHEDKRQ